MTTERKEKITLLKKSLIKIEAQLISSSEIQMHNMTYADMITLVNLHIMTLDIVCDLIEEWEGRSVH